MAKTLTMASNDKQPNEKKIIFDASLHLILLLMPICHIVN